MKYTKEEIEKAYKDGEISIDQKNHLLNILTY